MNTIMQRSALGNVIARQEGVRREGADRHSLSCLPGQGKVNAPDAPRVDRDQWGGVRRRVSGRHRELRRTVERLGMPGGGITVKGAHASDHPYGVRRIARSIAATGDRRTLQSGDQNSRRILFAFAERHIYSRAIRGRRSSHGGCRHGI